MIASCVCTQSVDDRAIFAPRRDFLIRMGAVFSASAISNNRVLADSVAQKPTTPNWIGCLDFQPASALPVGGATTFDDQSGSILIDRIVNTGILDIAKTYNLNPANLPGLVYAHGARENDAWVVDASYLKDTTHTVVLGAKRLVTESATEPHYGLVCIPLILAHEMGHVLQLNTGIVDRFRSQTEHFTRALELHADFLAGWYLGLDADWTQNAMSVANGRVRAWGDSCVESVTHHAFGQERAYFNEDGWGAAKYGAQDIKIVSKSAEDKVLQWVSNVPEGTSVCKP